jgi:hypothetical protein
VRSDSTSLPFMSCCKLNSSRISRYVHEIMANDVTIGYIKGTTNTFADILSCIPRHKCIQNIDARECNEVTIMNMRADGIFNLSRLIRGIKGLQEKDPVLKEIKRN